MGYSPPKCTCNGSTQAHSSKYMILLEYLHDMNENVTHPFPLLESSLTSSRMPKPNVRKQHFQNKLFLFLKTYYRVSVKSIRQPSEVNLLDNSPKQFIGPFDVNCWTISQPNSSENCCIEIPFTTIFLFLSCHALTPIDLSCPGAYVCHFHATHANISSFIC